MSRANEEEAIELVQTPAGGTAIVPAAASLGHDINQHLQHIMGQAELLLRKPLDKDGKKSVRAIITGVDDIAALTQNAISRATPTSIKMNDLMAAILDASAGQRVAHRIELKDDRCTEVLTFKAIAVEVRRAIDNLIDNAIEAMPNGGTLTVQTQQGYGGDDRGKSCPLVMLSLIDTGIGMEKEFASRAFTPHSTTKPTGQGIGLTTAAGYIHRNGGRITFTTSAGKGTRFDVSFPIFEPRPG